MGIKVKAVVKQGLKILRNIFACIGFVFVLLIVVFVFLFDPTEPSPICRPDLDPQYYDQRINMISREFRGGLSGKFEFIKFECSGFQDFFLSAELIADREGAESFVEGINTAYFNDDIEKAKEKRLLLTDPTYQYQANIDYLSGTHQRPKFGKFDIISVVIKDIGDGRYRILYEGVNP